MAAARRWLSSQFPKLTFRSFAFLLLSLALLALSPIVFFHTALNKEQAHECNWVQNPPLVCAHGGDSSKAPPNTIAAYELALSAAVDCIELDVSLTRDNVLVALHERQLRFMAQSDELHVGDLTLEQIRQLDAGAGFEEHFRGQKVPRMDTALRLVSRSVKRVIIDVKVGPPRFYDDLAREVQSVVNRTLCRNCVVWSKADRVVHDYMQLDPRALAGFIVMGDASNPEMLRPARIKRAEIAGVYHGLVDDELIATVHRARKEVYAWTVNEEQDMQRMLEMGVDCIITSKPRQLQHVMKKLKTKCQGLDW